MPAETSRPAQRLSGNLQGMLWMAGAGLVFVAFVAIVRHIGSDMHPLQIAFMRYAFGIVILAPVLVRMRFYQFRSARHGLHVFRGVIHAIAVLLWFYAMTRLPIAEVTALGFTAPIFATIGAAMFLGERLHLRRIGAVLIGFAGALVILRPGIDVIDVGAVAMLVAAPMFAGSKIITKTLSRTEPTTAIVAYLTVIVTLVMVVPALMVWQAPSLPEIGWTALTALLATASHLAIVRALKAAELTVTQPIEFLQLFWATLIGLYLFGEIPDLWTWVGGTIIVTSATYIAHREARSRSPNAADDRPGDAGL